MSERESEFIKELKLAITRGLVGLVGVIIVGLTVFYFSMTYDMQKTKIDIQELKQNKADRAVMEIKLEFINNALARIEGKLDKK